MTLFGRDSLLTSWMALLIDPGLALATLRTLARLQGTEDRDDNEEQPGKILHEVRFSAGRPWRWRTARSTTAPSTPPRCS
jgi:glycogen debranching enzyme